LGRWPGVPMYLNGGRGKPGYLAFNAMQQHTRWAITNWIRTVWDNGHPSCLCNLLEPSARPIRVGGTATAPPPQVPLPMVAWKGFNGSVEGPQ
jgi:hypothetical protein